jgi:hypothetical protein
MIIIVENIKSKERFILLEGKVRVFSNQRDEISSSGYLYLINKNGLLVPVSDKSIMEPIGIFDENFGGYSEPDLEYFYKIIEIDGKPISEIVK